MGFCIKDTICNVVETEKSKKEHIGTGSREPKAARYFTRLFNNIITPNFFSLMIPQQYDCLNKN